MTAMSEAQDRLDAANAALTAFTDTDAVAFAEQEAAFLARKRDLRDQLIAAEQAVAGEAAPPDSGAPAQTIQPHVPDAGGAAVEAPVPAEVSPGVTVAQPEVAS